MKRRESLKSLATLGLVSVGVPSLVTGNSLRGIMQEAKYATEIVRGNVGLFKERGGTIGWISTPEGFAVVDSQFPNQAKNLIDFLQKKQDKTIKYLLNSHHHGDHSAGNIAFKGIVDKVVAHENSKANQERVTKGKESQQLYPDTTFSKSWSGKIGKETVTSTYFGAAHTNGDAVIHFENDNVAHVGDLVFNRRHPYIDQSSGANIENWISVLASIRKHYDSDTIFICGHSSSDYDVKINSGDIRVAEEYFEALLETVQKALSAGKSKDEVLQISKLPGVDWADKGFERSLKAAYSELAK